MSYHKTVISFKEQAKRRLAALFAGNQNDSPPLPRISFRWNDDLMLAKSKYAAEMPTF
jgi:hypothetical protein